MLAVLEGLPGAGKTTALRSLAENAPINVIGEILSEEPDTDDEEFYIRNDTRKYRLIDPAKINIMDRNFVSTLCYNYCHDKLLGTNNYEKLAQRIDEELSRGTLRHPDIYIVLICSVATSLHRQNASNQGMWSDEQFLHLVHQFYQTYFTENDRAAVLINTDSSKTTEVLEKIKQTINTVGKVGGKKV